MTAFSIHQREENMTKVGHIPVMYREVLEYLRLPVDGCFVDGTVGLGGHSSLVAESLSENGRIIGIDRDEEALKIADEKLKGFKPQTTLVHDDFRNMDNVLDSLGIEKVDGVLLDLGISSFQLNNPQRGFSFQVDGPLDMRMDQSGWLSAYDLINSLSEREISMILRNYGEERFHNRIANYLVTHRTQHPIESTGELRDAVLKAMPHRYKHHYKRQKIHPATRTFQAFRIAVNRELEALEIVLDKCIASLKVGGRLCVLSFHSLEDRIVKHHLRNAAKAKKIDLIVKKPLRPTDEEIKENPRARSARLRVAEKAG